MIITRLLMSAVTAVIVASSYYVYACSGTLTGWKCNGESDGCAGQGCNQFFAQCPKGGPGYSWEKDVDEPYTFCTTDEAGPKDDCTQLPVTCKTIKHYDNPGCDSSVLCPEDISACGCSSPT